MFIKYPSIDNLKTVKKDIQKLTGVEVTPSIHFKGTVKIHGTNAGVTVSNTEEVFYQSRNRLLSLDNDNAGFCEFASSRKDIFVDLYRTFNWFDLFGVEVRYVTFFGEWCGGNIQKGVGVSGMDKTFILFGVGGSYFEDGEIKTLHRKIYSDYPEMGILNIDNFQTFEIDLDIMSQDSLDELERLTLQVEEECPVGTKLNPYGNGIGEGIVWTGYYKGCSLTFKHKGQKHQRGGGSKKVSVGSGYSPEQVQAVNKFCEEALTEDRLLQGVEYLKEMGMGTEMKNMGQYMKWVNQDILKECKVGIEELETHSDIKWKNLVKRVNDVVRKYYQAL